MCTDLQQALKLSEVDLDFILGGSGDELTDDESDLELVVGSITNLNLNKQRYAKQAKSGPDATTPAYCCMRMVFVTKDWICVEKSYT
jgi:hypothetical protein